MLNQKIEIDCLTGQKINPSDWEYNPNSDSFKYYCSPVGIVRISASAYIDLSSEIHKENRLKLAGICRHAYEKKLTPPLISTYSLDEIFRESDIPKSFSEKKIKLIEHLVFKGGKEYKENDLITNLDFPLVYSDVDEFKRIIKSLKEDGFININAITKDGYHGVLPTKKGIKHIENPPIDEIDFSKCLSEIERQKIISLIISANHKKALSLIEEIFIEKNQKIELRVTQGLKMRFNKIQERSLKGTITQEEANVRTAEIFDQLLRVLN